MSNEVECRSAKSAGAGRAAVQWDGKFAARTHGMRLNVVREFLKEIGRPGMISLAGGLPDPALFPVDEIQAAVGRVLGARGAQALQYGASEGIPELRSWIAEPFSSLGVTAENVLVTNGAMQALDLLGRVFIDDGDEVLVENPTYLALLSAWRACGAVFHALEPEGSGLPLPVRRFSGAAVHPKLLYTVPTFQNPTGRTLPLETRLAVIDAAHHDGFVVVEDDPYRELRYDGEALPSLFELSGGPGGPVTSVGSFSKILVPGFRLGWVVAARPVIDRLVQAKQSADLHTSTFAQHVAWELIRTGALARQLPRLRAAYRAKRDAMLAALARHLPPGISWTRPEGGMFIFVTFDERIHGREIARRAFEKGVAVVPGGDFHVGGGSNTIRLNFTNPKIEEIEIAIRRLAQVMEE